MIAHVVAPRRVPGLVAPLVGVPVLVPGSLGEGALAVGGDMSCQALSAKVRGVDVSVVAVRVVESGAGQPDGLVLLAGGPLLVRFSELGDDSFGYRPKPVEVRPPSFRDRPPVDDEHCQVQLAWLPSQVGEHRQADCGGAVVRDHLVEIDGGVPVFCLVGPDGGDESVVDQKPDLGRQPPNYPHPKTAPVPADIRQNPTGSGQIDPAGRDPMVLHEPAHVAYRVVADEPLQRVWLQQVEVVTDRVADGCQQSVLQFEARRVGAFVDGHRSTPWLARARILISRPTRTALRAHRGAGTGPFPRR